MVLLKSVCVHRAKRAAASAVLLAGRKDLWAVVWRGCKNFHYKFFLQIRQPDSFQISGYFLKNPVGFLWYGTCFVSRNRSCTWIFIFFSLHLAFDFDVKTGCRWVGVCTWSYREILTAALSDFEFCYQKSHYLWTKSHMPCAPLLLEKCEWAGVGSAPWSEASCSVCNSEHQFLSFLFFLFLFFPFFFRSVLNLRLVQLGRLCQ